MKKLNKITEIPEYLKSGERKDCIFWKLDDDYEEIEILLEDAKFKDHRGEKVIKLINTFITLLNYEFKYQSDLEKDVDLAADKYWAKIEKLPKFERSIYNEIANAIADITEDSEISIVLIAYDIDGCEHSVKIHLN